MLDVRIELTCPGCHEPFLVSSTLQGKIADCPFCNGWVDVPEIGRDPNGFERGDNDLDAFSEENLRQQEVAARQLAENLRQQEVAARQLVENARQIEQSQRLLDHRDRQDARFGELLDRFASAIERWEALAERMGRVADHRDRGDDAR